MKSPGFWLGLALLAGCQSSYLKERGDHAAARGALLQAAANYRAAAEGEAPEQVPALDRRREEVQALWLDERLEEARLASPEEARVILSRLCHTEWIGSTAAERVQAALEANFDRVWPGLEATAAKGHHYAAVRRALEFAADSRSPRVLQRLAELRRRGAQAHLFRAAEAPASAPLHRGIARTLDPSLELPPGPPPPHPSVEWVGPPSCEPILAALRAQLPAASGPKFRLVLTACSSEEQKRAIVEPYLSEVWVPETYTATVWTLVDDRLERRTTPAERLVLQPVRRERRVVERRLEAKVVGRLESLGWVRPPRPLASEAVHQDRAFWTPEASMRFDPIDPRAMERSLIAFLAKAIADEARAVSRAQAEADAARAKNEGGPAAAEGAWITALLAQGPWPEAATPYFQERYGLSPPEVTQFLGAQSITLLPTASAGEVLPPPERDPDEEAWSSFRVIDHDHQDDDRWLVGRGIDLYSKFEGAPMGGTPYAHGLGLRGRINGMHASLQGAMPWLGGAVEGVRLRLQGWSGEDFEPEDEHPLFRWSFGLGYEQWLDQKGGRFLGVGVPLAATLQPVGPVVFEAGVFLNFAQLKELVDADPSDPRHDSPIHVAVTFGQRHVYVRAEVIHDLGSDRTLRGGLELGVRL
jgi:hypothetical protein